MADERAQIQEWLSMMERHQQRGGVWNAYGLALAALRAEVERHSRWGIYEECGHKHGEDEPEMVVVECLDNPYTCEAGLIQAVCRECHTDSGEPRENTDEGEWPCAALVRLHRALCAAE
jgi:hypothetical protein